MRWLCLALLLPVGCASSVSRLPGEVPTPLGSAKPGCESKSWLVIAPTRSQELVAGGRTTSPRDDGLGLYRVGETSPESIPGLSDELGSSEVVERHAARVQRHDEKQIVAGSLGAVGLIALGIGSYLFATSFETTSSIDSSGTRQESHDIKGGRIAAGSLLIAAGFGFGIAGIVVSPSAGDRAKADQARYVFLPPEEGARTVTELVDEHNSAVRDRCAKTPAPK